MGGFQNKNIMSPYAFIIHIHIITIENNQHYILYIIILINFNVGTMVVWQYPNDKWHNSELLQDCTKLRLYAGS